MSFWDDAADNAAGAAAWLLAAAVALGVVGEAWGRARARLARWRA